MTASRELPAHLASEEGLDVFMEQFRSGALPKEVWTHAAHVTAAVCYCREFDPTECLDRLRRDIRRFNIAKGGENTEDAGYHETLTVFWLDTVRVFLSARCQGVPRLDAARAAVTEFAPQRDLFKRYYSFDVVKSREARARYLPPDL